MKLAGRLGITSRRNKVKRKAEKIKPIVAVDIDVNEVRSDAEDPQHLGSSEDNDIIQEMCLGNPNAASMMQMLLHQNTSS